jgi:MYXO-CTERM domain-containing protein
MNANSVKRAAIVAAAAFAFVPGAALAQNATDPAYDATANTQYAPVREDDDDFPWGLLGLLGLAGLLGLKRKDNDIHVDARRDTRP